MLCYTIKTLEANLVVDESKKSKDILKAVLNVATPVIISNLLYTVETLVSLLLVSHLGKSAIAGVGYSISMMWFVYSLMALTYNGTSIMVSHRVGAGKPFFDVFLSGMVLSLLLSIPIALFGTKFIPELMLLFGAKKDIANIATIYLKPIFLAAFIQFATEVFYATYSGMGQTKFPFKVSVIMNITNITSSYVLINGKLGFRAFGIEGAAFGIVISEVVGFLIYTYVLFVDKPFGKLSFKSLKTILEMLKLGIPVTVDRGLTSLSFNLFVGFVARFGNTILAAYQIGLRLESISFMIGYALSISASVLTGQNFGAGNIKGAFRGAKVIANFSALAMGIVGLIVVVLSKYMAMIFTSDKNIIHYAEIYLIMVGLTQVFLSYSFVLSGAIKGLGKTYIPMFVNILSFWIFRIIPILIMLKYIFNPYIPWVFMSVETVARAICFLMVFKILEKNMLEVRYG